MGGALKSGPLLAVSPGVGSRVTVDGFWIDRALVTKADFGRLVAETGHVTFAEIAPDAAQYPGAKPDMLRAGSLVFAKARGPVDMRDFRNWWHFVFGADWRHPQQGPQSSLDNLVQHPVVHVAYADAEAYARWAGKSIATEAEWETAARGVPTRPRLEVTGEANSREFRQPTVRRRRAAFARPRRRRPPLR